MRKIRPPRGGRRERRDVWMDQTGYAGAVGELPKKRGITGSTLKLIAVIAMLIDHTGAVVLERILMAEGLYDAVTQAELAEFMARYGGVYLADSIMRLVGRIAFPIFCFLLVEGFVHTRSKLRYLRNLAVFALISEPIFDMAVFGVWSESRGQNVYFTLFLGVLTLWGIQKAQGMGRKALGRLLSLGAAAAGCAAAWLLSTDYGGYGVLAIVAIYLLRGRPVAGGAAACTCLLPLSFLQAAGYGALIPIHLYNGERGLRMKYFFYLFYPVHLLLLYQVASMLGYRYAF